MIKMEEDTAVIKRTYLDPSLPGSLSSVNVYLRNNRNYKNASFVRETIKRLSTYSVHIQKTHSKGKLGRKVAPVWQEDILAADLAAVAIWSPNLVTQFGQPNLTQTRGQNFC